jgi:hypothetical protein
VANHVVVLEFAMLVPKYTIGLEGEWHDVVPSTVQDYQVTVLHQRGRGHRPDGHRGGGDLPLRHSCILCKNLIFYFSFISLFLPKALLSGISEVLLANGQ